MDEKEKELRKILNTFRLKVNSSWSFSESDRCYLEAIEEIDELYTPKEEKPCHPDLHLPKEANINGWNCCHKCGNWYDPKPINEPDFEALKGEFDPHGDTIYKDINNIWDSINKLVDLVEKLYKDKK